MRGPVAVLCSGQGGQHRDMFAWLGDAPGAASVFEAAAAFLDRTDPRRFVREADEAALFSNHAGQILCCTQALAAWALLGDRRPPRVVLAGYSVGELAAWGCAGLFSPAQTLQLASDRARVMDRAAHPGDGLGAIVGLRRPVLDPLLKAHDVHLAIVNGADSVVVGGKRAGLDACLAAAMHCGATTARRLRVAVPSHTTLLQAASTAFGHALDRHALQPGADGIRLLSGIDGDTIREPKAGLARLAAQVSHTIDWAGCLDACLEAGATTFLELGPGSALSRMASALPDAPSARSIEQFRSADGVCDWLARAG